MPLINKPSQHFDVITYTGNGKAVTVNGNAQISTAQSKFGGSSAYFDGTGDYLTTTSATDFSMKNGDWTIELWARFNVASIDASGDALVTIGDSVTNEPLNLRRRNDGIVVDLSTGGSNLTTLVGTTSTTSNQWYHIAATRYGNNIYIFANGVLLSTSSYSDTLADYTGLVHIGRLPWNVASDLGGYIDDLRIYKGVAKYTANFTPPTAALPIGPTDPYWQYCVLAMPMDGTNGSTTFPTFCYNASTDSALSFQPDLVWIKGRSGATDHAIYDAVRGTTKDLASNSTAAEVTNLNGLGVFNANGFTVGNLAKVNTSAATYVAWCWKAGNSTSSNTAGSITSTVSVNPTAGFSIAQFTAQSSGVGTFGHGLGSVPKFIMVRQTGTAANLIAYHQSVGNGSYLQVNLTSGSVVGSTVWNGTTPTSTVITLGSAFSAVGSMIAYCWSEVPGFSSFGSYTGNGNANGPFVNLGFRPAFVMFKCSSAAGAWVIFDDKRDGYNFTSKHFKANSSEAEIDAAGYGVDLLSNGFKVRATDASVNANASTYIYCAWAENPFKHSLAR